MARRRRRYEEEEWEEPVELDDVLEPYEQQWDPQQEVYYDQENSYVQDGYDGYAADYSDEHEAVDHEGRFRIALGMFDLASILVGVVVILMLVAMLITLINWLYSDIMNSALLLQSGLQ